MKLEISGITLKVKKSHRWTTKIRSQQFLELSGAFSIQFSLVEGFQNIRSITVGTE